MSAGEMELFATEIDRPLHAHEIRLVGNGIARDGKTLVDITCEGRT